MRIINYPDVKFGAITLVILFLVCLTLGILEVFGITHPKDPVNLMSIFSLFGLALFFALIAALLFTYKEKNPKVR